MVRLLQRYITVGRLVRYSAVSIIATTTSLVTLGLLVGELGVGATLANLIATACGIVPSFVLNRRWVWAQKGKSAFWRQFLPFCGLTVAGLVLSTVSVSVTARHTATWGRVPHTMAVELANVAAYGTVWVVQFFILDRLLFAPRSTAPPPVEVTPELVVAAQPKPAAETRDRALVG